MRRVDGIVRTVAAKDVIITLVGESGSGKEVLARRAHELSPRRLGPFVPINCAAIPEALFESELFGHERGAFTSATELARGKVESADGGTLFLDEVAELPLPMQAKLLRFIENRKYMRVGGTSKINADVRLVFATLRDLEEDVRSGRFRADLYYRIQGISVRVPPLRERRADLVPMVTQFLRQLSAKHDVQPPRLGREVMARMLAYSWPGNVRELRNVVESLCLLREGKAARLVDLPDSMRHRSASGATKDSRVVGNTIKLDLDEGLEVLTDKIIQAALTLERGNKSAAARRLKISLRSMQRYAAQGRVLDARLPAR